MLLAAADELTLSWLYGDAVATRRRAVAVHEPDLDGSLTAVALEPAAYRLVAHLPLALNRASARPLDGRGEVKSMTMTSGTHADLRTELLELAAERDALRAQLEGDLPRATRWLQRKVWRQAAALDLLNRRVVGQRFVLRTLDGLGRSLSADEYRDARDAVGNAALRERIDAAASEDATAS